MKYWVWNDQKAICKWKIRVMLDMQWVQFVRFFCSFVGENPSHMKVCANSHWQTSWFGPRRPVINVTKTKTNCILILKTTRKNIQWILPWQLTNCSKIGNTSQQRSGKEKEKYRMNLLLASLLSGRKMPGFWEC